MNNNFGTNKILGIISIILFILGWILYAKVGIIIGLIFEIISLVLGILSIKKEKNILGNIGIVGSIILLVIMLFIFVSSGVSSNVGDDALINKAKEIENSRNMN